MEHTHPITDPIERIIEDALNTAGIEYKRLYEGLDFTLSNGVQIECKAYYTERVVKQLSRHPNVILIQGKEAALTFANLLKK